MLLNPIYFRPYRSAIRDGTESKHPARALLASERQFCIPRDASTAFGPSLRPRRNSVQHDLDFESGALPQVKMTSGSEKRSDTLPHHS